MRPEQVLTDNPALPKGWINVSLEDIVSGEENSIKRGPFGSSIKKEFFVSKGYKVYEQKNIIYNDFSLGKYYIDGKKFQELEDFSLKAGDIVISCSGTIGKISVAPEGIEKGVINQALLKITLNPRIILTKYFSYLFSSYMHRKISVRGSAIQNISSVKSLKSIPFPLPPLAEQTRILSRIEELFTRLDAGVDSLRRAKLHLKQYHQSLQKHAFEGKLTERWREFHEPEDSSKLLEKIQRENKRLAAEIEPASIEPGPLPILPKQWIWTKMGDLLLDARYGTSKKCNYEPNNTAVLRIPNIVNGCVDLQDLKYTSLTEPELKQLTLEAGDMLVIRTNGSRDLVGKSAIFVNREGQFAFASYLIRLRVSLAKKIAKYLNLYLQSQFPLRFVQSNARTTAGQYNVNLGILSSIPIPLPSVEEQQKIVEELERHTSVIDSFGKAIEQAVMQSNLMRQSILKTAFEGTLLPQDSTDEPATILLQRIQAEKAGQWSSRISVRERKDVRQRRLI